MNKLNKDETKKYIIKIFNFIENGDSKFKEIGRASCRERV